ncbi:MAG: hypothetical protein LBU46_08395 [Candidatus Accumulibacter sp.]|jgi:formyltetrahydrofolate hydrolase|nr:hypothetical protein [Accumulibacter sp.]
MTTSARKSTRPSRASKTEFHAFPALLHAFRLVSDRVGIVARVAGFIAGHDGWILESRYHSDDANGDSRYFMRIDIKADSLPFPLAEFRERFRPLAA